MDTKEQTSQSQNDVNKLKLYDFHNIKAVRFFQIIAENNPLLLSKKELDINQLSENQVQQLLDRREEIQEQYNKFADKSGFDRMFNDKKYMTQIEVELIRLNVLSELIKIEELNRVPVDYSELLSELDISGSKEQIKRIIAQKRSRINLYLVKNKTEIEKIITRINEIILKFSQSVLDATELDKLSLEYTNLKKKLDAINDKESGEGISSFFDFLGIAGNRLGYHIPSDILLAEWCGLLNTLKQLNKQK